MKQEISTNNVDHDQGHPKTTCISEKYYSNLANGFVEKIFLYRHIRELAPTPGGHMVFEISS